MKFKYASISRIRSNFKTIYDFQNCLYCWYKIKSIYCRPKKTLKIIMPINANNTLRRAIGEEISDFLRHHKEILII